MSDKPFTPDDNDYPIEEAIRFLLQNARNDRQRGRCRSLAAQAAKGDKEAACHLMSVAWSGGAPRFALALAKKRLDAESVRIDRPPQVRNFRRALPSTARTQLYKPIPRCCVRARLY